MVPANQIHDVRPLIDFVDHCDIPLYDFLDFSMPRPGKSVLDEILVLNAWTSIDENSFTLGAEFFFPALTNLKLPGLDLLNLSFNGDAKATGTLICSEDPSLELSDIEISLQFSPALLSAADGSGSIIQSKCGLRFDREGFHLLSFGQAALLGARIAGTEVEVSLYNIKLGSTPDEFLSVGQGEVTLPMFTDATGSPLKLTGENLSLGRDGPSGLFKRVAGPTLKLSVYGFQCEIDEASFGLDRCHISELNLSGRMNLEKFMADDTQDGWVKVQFSLGPEGLSAKLSDDEPIIGLHIASVFDLRVDTIRLEAAPEKGAGTLWLSGSLTPEIDSVDGGWPTFEFDEIGISPSGGLRLASGATIATREPFSLRWNFLNLTVSAFSLQRPDDAPDDLELRISASVDLVAGMPAGTAVEGLVVRRRASDGNVVVRFDGISINYASPGGFAFAASISWESDVKRLSGSGYLDIPSLDMRLDVIARSEQDPKSKVTTFFLAAEAELVPGGIPIGTTGLCLYGVSGLLAYNLALDHKTSGPKRYFDTFMRNTPGFADPVKWTPAKGSHAFALGVVVGTADDGWVFSARGALMITIPDLVILLTATGELLAARQPLRAKGQGKLAALLGVYPAEKLVQLDFSAQWNSDPLFDVTGSGEGKFLTDRPLDWSINLGKNPNEGKPVSARMLKLGSDWFINSEYWFGIDASRQANIGMRSHIHLQAGVGGLYAELAGSIYGDVTLSWKPEQFEGRLDFSAWGRLVAGGLSIGVGFSAGISVHIARPTLLEIPLKACIEIDIGIKEIEICLRYTFRWRDEQPPRLEPMVHGLSAVPRHWSPRPSGDADKAVDDGVITYVAIGNGSISLKRTVAPHSRLILEFSKAMFVDVPVGPHLHLNDVATPYRQTIGKNSGWLARWSIDALALNDLTLAKPFALFGTFARSPFDRDLDGDPRHARAANSQLGLLSSRRFISDGSNGGGGAEETPPSDCNPKPDKITKCISLAGLSTGGGLLENGWAYNWESRNYRAEDRDNRYGVGMAGEDYFVFWPPKGVASVDVHVAKYVPHQPPVPGTEAIDLQLVKFPDPIGFSGSERILTSLCWEEWIGDADHVGHQDWRGSSGIEEWTAEAPRILIPRHDYELVIKLSGQLQRGTSNVGASIVMERTYLFTADRAPDWEGSLDRAIAARYPDDGRRPVYRHYDLFVLFKDDFFEALYHLDNRRLGVQLRSNDGEIVKGPDGDVLLPVSWERGPIAREPVERWWGKARAGNPNEPCEVDTPSPPDEGVSKLPIKLKDLDLKPHMRFIAELIAIDAGNGQLNATPPLAQWSFTTSRYATFSEMAAPPKRVPATSMAQRRAPTGSDFSALIRSFEAPVVAAFSEVRMTPVCVEQNIKYLLIEAPEPLDDEAGRLQIQIEGSPVKFVANLDKTRLITTLDPMIVLKQPNQDMTVTLFWNGESDDPTLRRAIGGVAKKEEVSWRVPLEGFFS